MDFPGGKGSVTIALLTRNAGPLLERVLAGVSAQETPREVELFALDSGSTDGTAERLRAHGARVLDIDPAEFDFGRSRDLAFQQARGEIVVNLSQDAVPAHSRWLENLIAPLLDPHIAISSGVSLPDPERDHPQFPWERNGWFYFTGEMAKFRRAHGRGVSFANSAVRRAVWEKLRIDPQALGEDFQFQMKAQREGLSVAFPGDAEVLHHHNYDLLGLWGRCRNEGLAMRQMGFPYTAGDLARDLASPAKYVQWLREVRHRRMYGVAAALFPVVRPLAVYAGGRFGRAYRPYSHRAEEAA
jgi:rhamnosyltransferase